MNRGHNKVRKEPYNICVKAIQAEGKCRGKGPEAGTFEELSGDSKATSVA